MIAFVSFLVAFACAGASARRVWLAIHATAIDPEEAFAMLGRRHAQGLDVLRSVAAKDPHAEWERDLIEALAERDEEKRAALVNEQMTELGHRLDRWAAVPRVCARVSTSTAFLLAALVLRRGLTEDAELPSDLGQLLFGGLIGQAFTVAALGLVGTAVCVAAHTQARRIKSEKAAAADKLVERLESLAAERDPG